VLVTHDQNIAEHCRRIIRISDGQIFADEAIAKPKNAAAELTKLPSEKKEAESHNNV
jgi:ABC-type lipoprotein export system ATPase subunit